MSEQAKAYEVTIKGVEAVRVASVKHNTPVTMPEIPQVMEELFGMVMPYIFQHGAQVSGASIAIYDGDDKTMTIEVAIPIAGDLPESDAVKVYTLPALDSAACITHVGSYDGLSGAHDMLYGWTMQNGYTITAGVREVYLKDMQTSENAAEWITELQYPVKKA